MYRVTVSPEVAKLLPNGDGRRRRPVKTDHGLRMLEFSRQPTFLDILPPEIEEDPFLLSTQIPAKEAKGGPLVQLQTAPAQGSAKTNDSATNSPTKAQTRKKAEAKKS